MRRGSGDDAWIIVAWHATAGTRSVVIPMEDARPLQWENTTINFCYFLQKIEKYYGKLFGYFSAYCWWLMAVLSHALLYFATRHSNTSPLHRHAHAANVSCVTVPRRLRPHQSFTCETNLFHFCTELSKRPTSKC